LLHANWKQQLSGEHASGRLVARLRADELLREWYPLLHRLYWQLPDELQRLHVCFQFVWKPPRLLQSGLHELWWLADSAPSLPNRPLRQSVQPLRRL